MPVDGVAPHLLPAGAAAVPKPREPHPGQNDAAAARKVAREFEAMFIGMMLKSMRATAGGDALTGGGRAEETYRSLLDQEYAMAAAQGGGIGLARSIEREISRGYGAAPEVTRGANED